MENQSTPIQDQISLEYYGPPTKMGRLNSYDVAGYIIAFSDFLGVTSRRVYGEKITVNTEIQGFKGNSFDIYFAFQVAFVAANLFTGNPTNAKDLLSTIKECINAWIHLWGLPPKAVSPVLGEANQFKIENQNGQITYISGNVVNIITDPKAGSAVEGFIKKPLESGVTSVHLHSKAHAEIAKINQDESLAFVPINVEKQLLETEMEMHLVIESPTFKEGNKWKVWDGQNSFYADILDEDFIKRVDDGIERFGKGDALKAIIRFSQSQSMGSLKMERVIIKVLKHEISSIEQTKLL